MRRVPLPGKVDTALGIFMTKKVLALFAFVLWLPLALAGDDFGAGLAAFNKGEYGKALAVFKKLADQGNPEAQLKLGLMYHYGLGTKENDALAFGLIRKSAEQANADAQFQLANMYLYGFGVPKKETDPDLQAVQWYFKAALQGHADAQYNLGLMFLAGKGVQQSHEEGVKWITRAAEQGHPGAQAFLGSYK